ncbi:MAG: hypothetical protein WBA77_21580 [Microcoleaceae cyanobacterium]
MDILGLSILFGMIMLSDEVLNGQLKLSRRLLARLDQLESRKKHKITHSTRSK